MSTKIHALVDALGNPLRFLLTPGQAHDLTGADALLPQMAAEVLIAAKPTMPTIGDADRLRFPRFPCQLANRGNARLRPHTHRHHSQHKN